MNLNINHTNIYKGTYDLVLEGGNFNYGGK